MKGKDETRYLVISGEWREAVIWARARRVSNVDWLWACEGSKIFGRDPGDGWVVVRTGTWSPKAQQAEEYLRSRGFEIREDQL